ncbi:MAG: urease accessory protein UreJ [Rhizobiales bacterium]|nr:urease accessory protein UreJ [Hyphomicrobiales bacterium]
MGGMTPTTFIEGLLSGLGHPVIGIDHLAAVVAVGCLAVLHRSGTMSVLGYVLATFVGVAIHLRGTTVPAEEILVAISLLLLGALLVWRQPMQTVVVVTLFVVTGLLHGYVLGESIVGAEPAPLASYILGLAVIQSAIGLGVLMVARRLVAPALGNPPTLRIAGAVVVIVGAVALLQQLTT